MTPTIVMLCRICGHDAFYHKEWTGKCSLQICEMCWAVSLDEPKDTTCPKP